jgi:gamma-glutamylcyclotransferase (GGCT)/AIG2-like uncharacterized protein YtfP
MNQLFVYGSLRSGFRSPAYEYISRYFTFVANAKVRGELYDLGSYPAGIKSNGNTESPTKMNLHGPWGS